MKVQFDSITINNMAVKYKLTPNETIVLQYISSFKDNGQPFLFSNAGIAEKVLHLEPTESNCRYVRRILKSMNDKGVIKPIYQNDNKNGNRIDIIITDYSATKELLNTEPIFDRVEDLDLPFGK